MSLKKFIPRLIRRKVFSIVNDELITARAEEQNLITKTDLKDQHISNTRLVASREDLLQLFPSNGIVAEIGVDEGKFTEKILSLNKPKKLHLIDVWNSDRFNTKKKNDVHNKFAQELNAGKVEVNLGYSTEVAKSFDDEYFDWIYIDTDHSYETTLQELISYEPKIKQGGIIAGHDYIQGYWIGMVKYGVVEAVAEFCMNNNWEIIYLTTELSIHPSFAIRKL